MPIEFDGGNWDGVEVADAVILRNIFGGGGTAMGWIYLYDWASVLIDPLLMKAEDSDLYGLVENGWMFGPTAYGSWNCLWFDRDRSTSRGTWRTPTDSFTLNQWNHIAVTYNEDSTANDPIIYLNGTSLSVSEVDTPSGTPNSDSGFSMRAANNKNKQVIDGMIEDARLYNRILAADEIAAIHEMQGRDGILDGLIFWMPMNEGYDGQAAPSVIPTAFDISGNGNDGAILDSCFYRDGEVQLTRSLN